MSIAELYFLAFVGHVTIGAFVIFENPARFSSPLATNGTYSRELSRDGLCGRIETRAKVDKLRSVLIEYYWWQPAFHFCYAKS